MPTEVIDEYLARPRSNFDFMKAVPEEELRADIHELGYRFCSKPWIQQLVGFLIAEQNPNFLFYYDMGAGKTKLAYDMFRFRAQRKECSRALVVVPETIHMSTWTEQLNEHAPDLKLCVLSGSKEERLELIKTTNADLCLINHAGLQTYMTDLQKVKGKKRLTRKINPDAATAFVMNFDFLILDEVHRIKSHTSLLFELLRWLSIRCPFRYGFTGTPFGRYPEYLWPQFYLVDHGETLGSRMNMFRAAFFEAKANFFGGVDYTFRKDQTEVLHNVIKNRSLSYTTEELQTLPQRLAIKIPVPLNEEGQMLYNRIISKIREQRGDYRSVESNYIRMRQCASGYMSFKPEEDSDSKERIQFKIKDNPKLNALRMLLEDRIAGRKVIVYHHFRYTGEMIADLLRELKIQFAAIRGGVRDVQAEFTRFKTDSKVQVLLANTQVGSEAINPQGVCHIEVFFESPEDPLTRLQAERRVRRSGQKSWHVIIYDIFAKGTIEERLLQYHKEGHSLMKAILTGDENLIVDGEAVAL